MADQTIGDRFRRAVAGAAGRIAARSPRRGGTPKADSGVPMEPVVPASGKAPAGKAPAGKAPARKAAANKAPANKSVAKKAPARKVATKKAPARKVATKKAPARKAATKQAPVDTPPAESVESGTTGSSEGSLPVRPGEDPWTLDEIEDVGGELREDLDRLNAELIAMDAGLAELLSEGVATAGDDQADTGSKSFEREHEMALAGNVREMRDQVQRALDRLAAGSFGICQSCGQPIGKLRLRAFPRATLCLDCKRKQERR